MQTQELSRPPPAYTRFGGVPGLETIAEESSHPAYESIELTRRDSAPSSTRQAWQWDPVRRRIVRVPVEQSARPQETMPPSYEDLLPSSTTNSDNIATAAAVAAAAPAQPKPAFWKWNVWRRRTAIDIEAGVRDRDASNCSNVSDVVSVPLSRIYTPQGESPITRRRMQEHQRMQRRGRMVFWGVFGSVFVLVLAVILVVKFVVRPRLDARLGHGGTDGAGIV